MVGSPSAGGEGTLVRQVAQRMKDEGAHNVAMKYEEYAQNVDKEISAVRELILNGHAKKRAIVADDQDKTNGSSASAKRSFIRDVFNTAAIAASAP
jgi:hypothetical protein